MDCVILAAGKGTRMNSAKPKVVHEIGGKPLVGHLLESLYPLELSKVIVVVGYKGELVRDKLATWDLKYAVQKEQNGTAHALLQARQEIGSDTFLIFPGDLPLVTTSSVESFINSAQGRDSVFSLLTVRRSDPKGYGRIKRDGEGRLKEIIEEQDATDNEKEIKEVNTGVYLLPNREETWKELGSIDPENAQEEFYLTDLVKHSVERGETVTGIEAESPEEFLGVNTRRDLARAGQVLNQRKIESLMDAGVTIVDPESTRIDSEVEIEQDTRVEPFTVIKGGTKIGPDAKIGPNVEITDGRIGAGVNIAHAVVNGTRIGEGALVEPFQHLGPNQVVEPTKVGP